jgi:heptosyltransferase II
MRFLIVRIAALGDIAMSTTLLSRIRAEHPDAHVAWLCGTRYSALVERFPGVDEAIAVDEEAVLRGSFVRRVTAVVGLWRRLLRQRFDRVLILHADPRYRLLTLPLFRSQIDMASHGPGPHTNPLPGRYRGDESARLFDGDSWAGPDVRRYPLADLRSALPRSGRAGTQAPSRVVIVPGGARSILHDGTRRRWPVASYRLLAEEMLKVGHSVALIGDEHDTPFAAHFHDLPVRNLVGSLTLLETMAELRDADIVVTHDTGPMHLARLVRTPMVVLFGPTDPREFIGDDHLVTVIWGGAQLACRPCYDGRDYPPCANHVCMQSITVAEVVRAVTQRLAASRPQELMVS